MLSQATLGASKLSCTLNF